MFEKNAEKAKAKGRLAKKDIIAWRAGYIDAVFVGILGNYTCGSPTDLHKGKEGYQEGYLFALEQYRNGVKIEELEETAWGFLELYPI